MAYLVTDNCVKCKHTTCVSVCPVDCFYEGDDMLVINPDECIDCGVCVPECPADAIFADVDLSEADQNIWLARNAKYSQVWPNIDEEQDPLADHELYDGMPNKFEQYVELKND